MNSAAIRTVLGVCVVVLFVTGTARAQVVAGEAELLGFVGGVSDGGGVTVGGGIQVAASDRVIAAVEVGYLTGGESFSGFGIDVDSYGISVDGNVHYLFPMDNERFTPYVLGGIGYLRATASVSGFGASAEGSASAVGLNLGGGARYQAGENWGLRPELKVFIEDGSNVRFSVGVYWGF